MNFQLENDSAVQSRKAVLLVPARLAKCVYK